VAGVERALAHGARVLVVGQPSISDRHVTQQRHLAALLRERFGHDPRVVYVDLGGAVDLRDRGMAWDGMHLTPPGNAVIAERLVEPVLRLLD
jgi:lysophospholipase L1-like esterase